MTTKHQITGLGPVKDDGSQFIFTAQPAPFVATKEWLDEQLEAPVIGDFLVHELDGTVTLETETQGEGELEAQKKSDGEEDSANCSKDSPFKVYAGHTVKAAIITDVEKQDDGSFDIILTDGTAKNVTSLQLVDNSVEVGDYFILEEDGEGELELVANKKAFEAEFSPVTA